MCLDQQPLPTSAKQPGRKAGRHSIVPERRMVLILHSQLSLLFGYMGRREEGQEAKQSRTELSHLRERERALKISTLGNT